MGILRGANFRRHTKVLRSLDYENMSPSIMRDEGAGTNGRLSDSVYEGTTRVPASGERDETLLSTDDGHKPVEGERPHPRAQWDDVAGVWVVWDDEHGDWLPVEAES